MTLGFLLLTNPSWLWALPAAVGLPLIIHLLSHQGGRRVVFPTIRLMLQAEAHRVRIYRVRQWVLLFLRSAILSLIVMAFARPVWLRADGAQEVAPFGVTALLLDRSVSMSRIHRGTTLFDEARRQVIERLRQLQSGMDRATVVVIDGAPRSVLPEVTSNIAQLINHVEQIQLTHERGDVQAAMQLTINQIQRALRGGMSSAMGGHATAGGALVELYSDLQRTQFSENWSQAITENRWQHRIHPIGGVVSNVAMFNPTVFPVRPIVGQEATVTVQLASYGPDASPREVTVTMNFDGHRQERNVEVRSGTTQTILFSIQPKRPGVAWIEWCVEQSESFELDNRTELCVTVDPARRVGLVSRSDIDDSESAAYYFARALTPRSVEHGGVGVDLVPLQPRELIRVLSPSVDSTAPTVVVMVEAGHLDRSQLQDLHDFLRQGGGVIWMIDSVEAVQALRAFDQIDPAQSIAPLVLRAGQAWRTGIDLKLASGWFEDPLLRVFDGAARSGLFAHSFRAVASGTTAPTAIALLRFSDQTPALTAGWIGLGRLAVFGVDLSPGQTDWAKGPAFVPLLHQLVRYLTPGPPTTTGILRPGTKPVVAISPEVASLPQPWNLQGPEGQEIAFSNVSENQESPQIQLNKLSQVGRYELRSRDSLSLRSGWFVEVDPAESDLDRLDSDETHIKSPSKEMISAKAPDLLSTSSFSQRQSVALWPVLLLLAVVAMILESMTVRPKDVVLDGPDEESTD